MNEYNIKVVKALNGWVVHCGGIYVVPEDGDLGGTVAAAITAERMEPTPKVAPSPRPPTVGQRKRQQPLLGEEIDEITRHLADSTKYF